MGRCRFPSLVACRLAWLGTRNRACKGMWGSHIPGVMSLGLPVVFCIGFAFGQCCCEVDDSEWLIFGCAVREPPAGCSGALFLDDICVARFLVIVRLVSAEHFLVFVGFVPVHGSP